MLRTISSKVAANNLRKNQLSVKMAARAFASGPQANQFDKVKTTLGSHQFYKLPLLGDSRLGRLTHSNFLTIHICSYSPILNQSSLGVSREKL